MVVKEMWVGYGRIRGEEWSRRGRGKVGCAGDRRGLGGRRREGREGLVTASKREKRAGMIGVGG